MTPNIFTNYEREILDNIQDIRLFIHKRKLPITLSSDPLPGNGSILMDSAGIFIRNYPYYSYNAFIPYSTFEAWISHSQIDLISLQSEVETLMYPENGYRLLKLGVSATDVFGRISCVIIYFELVDKYDEDDGEQFSCYDPGKSLNEEDEDELRLLSSEGGEKFSYYEPDESLSEDDEHRLLQLLSCIAVKYNISFEIPHYYHGK